MHPSLKIKNISSFDKREFNSNIALSPAEPISPHPFTEKRIRAIRNSKDETRTGSRSKNEPHWKKIRSKRQTPYSLARSKTDFPIYNDSAGEDLMRSPVSEVRNIISGNNTNTRERQHSDIAEARVSNLDCELEKKDSSLFGEIDAVGQLYSQREDAVYDDQYFGSFSRNSSNKKVLEGRRKRMKSHSLKSDIKIANDKIKSSKDVKSNTGTKSQAKNR